MSYNTTPNLNLNVFVNPSDLGGQNLNTNFNLIEKFYTLNNKTVISPNDLGAKGDGVYIQGTSAITNGQKALTVTGGSFTKNDIGKLIKIDGAGSAGADLITTIAGFTSATSVNLTVAAANTVSTGNLVYGTDDTVAIQAAVNLANANGGGIIRFNPSIYIIGGSFTTAAGASSSPNNGQIVLPARDLISQETIAITLEGVYGADNINWVGDEVQPLCMHGTVLWSLRADPSSPDNAIIAGAGPTGATWAFSALVVTVQNMTIRTYKNPNHSALNFSAIGGAIFKNLMIDSGVPINGVNHYDTIGSSAIILPTENNWCVSLVNNVDIAGYETAIRANEHADIDYTRIFMCNRALVPINFNHSMRVGRLLVVNCRYAIYSGGGAAITIENLGIEHGGNLIFDPITSTNSGTMIDISDVSNTLYGYVNMHIVSDVMNVPANHAKNLSIRAIAGIAPQQGSALLASPFDLTGGSSGAWQYTGLQSVQIFSGDYEVDYTVNPSLVTSGAFATIETKLVRSDDTTDVANSKIQAAFALSGSVINYTTAINADSPLAFFLCQETSGTTWTDTSGNTRTGTINSAGVTYSNAGPLSNQSTKALGFNGSTGYATATLASLVSATAHATVEGWLFKAAGSAKAFLGFGGSSSSNRCNILWNNDANVYFQVEPDSAGSNFPFVAFASLGWHHFVMVYDGSQGTAANRIVAYIDGVQQTLTQGGVGNPTVLPSTAHLATFDVGREVGTSTFGACESFGVALFSTSLTSSQVLNHYNAGNTLMNAILSYKVPPVRTNGNVNLKLYARYIGSGITSAIIGAGSRITTKTVR